MQAEGLPLRLNRCLPSIGVPSCVRRNLLEPDVVIVGRINGEVMYPLDSQNPVL